MVILAVCSFFPLKKNNDEEMDTYCDAMRKKSKMKNLHWPSWLKILILFIKLTEKVSVLLPKYILSGGMNPQRIVVTRNKLNIDSCLVYLCLSVTAYMYV